MARASRLSTPAPLIAATFERAGVDRRNAHHQCGLRGFAVDTRHELFQFLEALDYDRHTIRTANPRAPLVGFSFERYEEKCSYSM